MCGNCRRCAPAPRPRVASRLPSFGERPAHRLRRQVPSPHPARLSQSPRATPSTVTRACFTTLRDHSLHGEVLLEIFQDSLREGASPQGERGTRARAERVFPIAKVPSKKRRKSTKTLFKRSCVPSQREAWKSPCKVTKHSLRRLIETNPTPRPEFPQTKGAREHPGAGANVRKAIRNDPKTRGSPKDAKESAPNTLFQLNLLKGEKKE